MIPRGKKCKSKAQKGGAGPKGEFWSNFFSFSIFLHLFICSLLLFNKRRKQGRVNCRRAAAGVGWVAKCKQLQGRRTWRSVQRYAMLKCTAEIERLFVRLWAWSFPASFGREMCERIMPAAEKRIIAPPFKYFIRREEVLKAPKKVKKRVGNKNLSRSQESQFGDESVSLSVQILNFQHIPFLALLTCNVFWNFSKRSQNYFQKISCVRKKL